MDSNPARVPFRASDALLLAFAKESGMSINAVLDATLFLLVFSGFEYWPELYVALVDDDPVSTRETETIARAHHTVVTFEAWYEAYTTNARASGKFRTLDVSKSTDGMLWHEFARLFHREDPVYQRDLVHISAMYLCIYHGRNVPGRPETFASPDGGEAEEEEEYDEEYGSWLKSALGDYQLLGDTIQDIEAFNRDHPLICAKSLLFLADCAHKGMLLL